jgi:hypothetical protein
MKKIMFNERYGLESAVLNGRKTMTRRMVKLPMLPIVANLDKMVDAEVGISTSKLHARGPVGLEGLVTYKYKIRGNGNLVADYSDGTRKFTHKHIL